ncbi:YegP family protein [Solemya elarraichensis gill symbiont]|uniref:DUF1508 domain-containing protein n=1 Tax=Solemya elarraichensis gill symbiont TaxID=1918949 RepID=A0A1T2KZU9_9GAMM|nr:YegP family protein [Solemya elarraichensis gill symbiont]OOZ38300.1 hypothetical protein BOW52_08825 [Solemya elarraichensis gill symbiont]
MAGKFEIYKDRKGEFRFRLKASNGQIILASQGYKTKQSCKAGIASVMKNALSEKNFEKKASKRGCSFTMISRNKQAIGTSQTYKSEASRNNGIASVGRNATDATIVDTTV